MALPAPTLAPPVEDAFAVHVHHSPLTKGGHLWKEGHRRPMPPVPIGGVFIFDLRREPVALTLEPFQFSRFHISRDSIDELASEQGIARPGTLREAMAERDPVLAYLAGALLERMRYFGPEIDSLFADGVALSFFAHISRRYAGVTQAPIRGGALASWQAKRLSDWANENLDG
ncbi:MAG TPA: hypothetical protein VKR38_01110, partial [Usitatibacter sp.]|nr:hypothetical protein [Usitatibacter sp.]